VLSNGENAVQKDGEEKRLRRLGKLTR